MSYKNYLAISKTSAEKFEALDNDAQDKTSTFNDAGVPYAEFVVSKGRNVAKPICTFDPTVDGFIDSADIKAFQDKFLTANNGEFANYPAQEIGNYYSADMINMVRRMLNPTENLFTIPVSADMKDKFLEIFSNTVVGTPKKYATVNQFRFELNFDDSPSYEQVLQLRTFMTLMESEYSTLTGTKVTTGQITADNIARELGPDMATLYDFAFEYTEKTFKSKVMLSEEFPKVDGPILNAYLHARQGITIDQPLKADDFFTRAMDGRDIQQDFLGVYDAYIGSKTYLDYIQEGQASLNYPIFNRTLDGGVEPIDWEDEAGTSFHNFHNALTQAEKDDLEKVLADFNNTIEFSVPINNADGTQVASIQAQGIFEPIPAGFRLVTAVFTMVAGTVPDEQAHAQFASMQRTAEERFNQYLKARGF